MRPLRRDDYLAVSSINMHVIYSNTHLRIDNSRRGAVHVLWNFSRTKIATTASDISNKRAFFSACVDANGILINLELKKRQI